jgi:hypothetical protein
MARLDYLFEAILSASIGYPFLNTEIVGVE